MSTGAGRAGWRYGFLSLLIWGTTPACGGDRDQTPSNERTAASNLPARDTGLSSSPSSTQPPAGDSGTVPVDISVVVGGTKANASGRGECTHTTEASIYDAPAAQWAARYSGSDETGLQHLNLTVWELKSGGPPQLTLSFQVGSERHDIATVTGGPLKGSGNAAVRPAGAAGTLSINGKDDLGNQVTVTVRCARFTEPVAEGG